MGGAGRAPRLSSPGEFPAGLVRLISSMAYIGH
jgi:hypothetical protein